MKCTQKANKASFHFKCTIIAVTSGQPQLKSHRLLAQSPASFGLKGEKVIHACISQTQYF